MSWECIEIEGERTEGERGQEKSGEKGGSEGKGQAKSFLPRLFAPFYLNALLMACPKPLPGT